MLKRMNQKGQIAVFLLLGVVVAGSFFLVGGFSTKKKPVPVSTSSSVGYPLENTSKQAKNNIQIDTATFASALISEPPQQGPTPTPGAGQCAYHGEKTASCTCPGKEVEMLLCYNVAKCPQITPSGLMTENDWKTCEFNEYKPGTQEYDLRANGKDSNCKAFCVGKPVIYLYPQVITRVDVDLTIAGSIVKSDPVYPKDGWRNVLAHPDGTLYYQGRKYHELFYETSEDHINPPSHGMIVTKDTLEDTLWEFTHALGLIHHEQQEFVDYWLPQLNDLGTPYILLSVLEDKEKQRIDTVTISPKPDKFIAFLAYFKGLNTLDDLPPQLSLPETPPQRHGFTAVEWGGVIDYQRSDKPLVLN